MTTIFGIDYYITDNGQWANKHGSHSVLVPVEYTETPEPVLSFKSYH